MGNDFQDASPVNDHGHWMDELTAGVVVVPLTPEEIEINAHWERIHKAFDKRG